MSQPVNPFGTDLQSLPNPAANGQVDLDPSMLEGSGRVLLAQSLVRRQTTPTGSVIDCPNDCVDVRGWISQGWTQQEFQAASGNLKTELLKDERITDVTITMTLGTGPAAGTQTLTIVEQFESAYGPFTLTLLVSEVTVSILIANQGTFGQGTT
jgi:hypothetical protein